MGAPSRNIFKQIIEHVANVRDGNRHIASVTSNVGGNPLGAPPAIGDSPNPARQPNPWAGGTGWMDGGGSRVDGPDVARKRMLPAHRPPDSIQPEGRITRPVSFTRTNDALWWDSERPFTDILWHRHRRQAMNGWASLRAFGSSDVASGPEGTLVLFPPHMPRPGHHPRSVAGAKAGNVLLNYADTHAQTPNVPVVP